jgi:hypothetical protein
MHRLPVRAQDGFHYFRAQLDAMPDPQLAHARRGAEWTFDARAYHACLQQIKDAGGQEGGGSGRVARPVQPCGVCSLACPRLVDAHPALRVVQGRGWRRRSTTAWATPCPTTLRCCGSTRWW